MYKVGSKKNWISEKWFRIPKHIREYFIITGVVWLFYAVTLPVFFHVVFDWGIEEVINWWIYGTPVEFILAYPQGKLVIWAYAKFKRLMK